jgi:hypothetical protein
MSCTNKVFQKPPYMLDSSPIGSLHRKIKTRICVGRPVHLRCPPQRRRNSSASDLPRSSRRTRARAAAGPAPPPPVELLWLRPLGNFALPDLLLELPLARLLEGLVPHARCSREKGLRETIDADERRLRGSFQLRPKTRPAMTPS